MPLDAAIAPARDALARLRDDISAVQEARAAAQEAVDRLQRPAAEVLIARAEHAAEKATFDAQIVRWYENGCVDDRPDAPLKLLRLEHQIGDLTRNLGVVEDRLNVAQNELQRYNEQLAQLQTHTLAV
jgi:hypothetical protein